MSESNSIRIITEPAVYLVGKQMIGDAELDRFLADHGVSWESDSEVAAEVLTETAGRICYMSFAKPRPGGNAAYLDHIKEVGHGSVLEHAVWNFIFTGVSRTLTHELVRHRAGFGYSQLSQRYVDESVAEYVEPDVIADDPELHAIWLDAVQPGPRGVHQARREAEREARRPEGRRGRDAPARHRPHHAPQGRPAGGAERAAQRHRDQDLRHRQRPRPPPLHRTARQRHAEPEIRKLAGSLLDVLQKDAPNLFGDYTKVPLPDGTFELTTQYKKV